MSIVRILLVVAFALALPEIATAGTFCVIGSAIPPQCLYEDVQSCSAASAPPNTFCGVNPEAPLMYYGSQPYCTVSSDRVAQCLFVDRSQCNSQAARSKALCIDRNAIEEDDLNPFKYDQRVQTR